MLFILCSFISPLNNPRIMPGLMDTRDVPFGQKELLFLIEENCSSKLGSLGFENSDSYLDVLNGNGVPI